MNTKIELKKSMIKTLYDLSGEIYYHKFLEFTYQSDEIKEIMEDIETLKNKISSL